MGFRTKHLSTSELADIRRGDNAHLIDLVHLAECSSCKQQFADALILRQLTRDVGTSTTAGPHPSVKEIDHYHASAYEAGETDPDTFLNIDGHLQKCDACFAKFMRIHERLSPSRHLIDRVVKQAAQRVPKQIGVLVLQKALDSISLALQPANLRQSEVPFGERALKRLLHIAQPKKPSRSDAEPASDRLPSPRYSRRLHSKDPSPPEPVGGMPDLDFGMAMLSSNREPSARESRDSDSYMAFRPAPELERLGSLRIENIELVVQRMPDPKRVVLVLRAIDIESGRPSVGTEVAEIDAEGAVVASGTTDASGGMAIELLPGCERLRVTVGKNGESWEIRIQIEQEFFRTSHPRVQSEEEAEARAILAKEAEVRRVQREAKAAARRERAEQIAKFRALSPEEQIAWIASDVSIPAIGYQAALPALTLDLLARIDPEILRKLSAKLAKIRSGPLVAARKVLEAYLAGKSGGRT